MRFFTPASEDTTAGVMTFFIPSAQVDGEDLDTFDEIGVFTVEDEGNEICVGSVSLHESTDIQNPVKIIALKDNDDTPEKDGFAEGDSIRYKFGKPGANDIIYNTITYTFPYDAEEGYNFEEFSTSDTCFVNLAFETPPPVNFFFETTNSCLSMSEDIFITALNFSRIDTLELEIILDTARYEFEEATPLQPFLNGMETGFSENQLNISWADESGQSVMDNDTLISLTVYTKNDGETGIWWSDNSYTTGIVNQETQFNDHTFDIESIPTHPGNIFGDDEVCTGTVFSNYNVASQSNAEEYLWELSDEEAGNLSPSGNEVTVIWNNDFEGETNLTVSSSNYCGVSPEAEKAIDVTTSAVVELTISNTISSDCEGDTIQFVAEGVNGGNNPVYDWYINDTLQGIHSTTLQRTDFMDGDEIYCVLTSSSACAVNNPAQSEVFELELAPRPARPGPITGPDEICHTIPVSYYTTAGGQYSDDYVWTLTPTEMGEVVSNGNNAEIYWNDAAHGPAYIEVSGLNNCGIGPARQFITSRVICTDNDTQPSKNIEVYPNPFKENITIEPGVLKSGAKVMLNDLRGTLVHSEEITNPLHLISTHHLPRGMYILKVINGEEVSYRKVVKK